MWQHKQSGQSNLYSVFAVLPGIFSSVLINYDIIFKYIAKDIDKLYKNDYDIDKWNGFHI